MPRNCFGKLKFLFFLFALLQLHLYGCSAPTQSKTPEEKDDSVETIPRQLSVEGLPPIEVIIANNDTWKHEDCNTLTTYPHAKRSYSDGQRKKAVLDIIDFYRWTLKVGDRDLPVTHLWIKHLETVEKVDHLVTTDQTMPEWHYRFVVKLLNCDQPP